MRLFFLVNTTFILIAGNALGETRSCRDILFDLVSGKTGLTKQVKQVGEIRDQCQFTTCWLNAATSSLEHTILAKTGQTVELSIDYLMVHDLIDSSITYLKRALVLRRAAGYLVHKKGGNRSKFHTLLERFGIVRAQNFHIGAKRWDDIASEWPVFMKSLSEAGSAEGTSFRDEPAMRDFLVRKFHEIFKIAIPDPSHPIGSQFKTENPLHFLEQLLGYTPISKNVSIAGNPRGIRAAAEVDFEEGVKIVKQLIDSGESAEISANWSGALRDKKGKILEAAMAKILTWNMVTMPLS